MTFNKVFPIGHPDSAPASSHLFPVNEALAMRVTGPEWNSVKFAMGAVLDLMRQENVHGIGVYYAQADGHATVVLAPLDSDGQPITTDGTLGLEKGERCPPFC